MNKHFIIVPLFLLIVCSSRLTESEPVQTAPAFKTSCDVNPNGSSELSLLMRKMYEHVAGVRKKVVAKKLQKTFPKEFFNIYTAKPTDSTTKNASFDPFAGVYLNALNTLTASTANELVLNYNGVVNACIACHSQHCPGPVSKIKKLLIAASAK